MSARKTAVAARAVAASEVANVSNASVPGGVAQMIINQRSIRTPVEIRYSTVYATAEPQQSVVYILEA